MDQEELPQQRHAYPDDHWLLYSCPWCHAAPFEQCHIVGIPSARYLRPHNVRLELVGTAAAMGA